MEFFRQEYWSGLPFPSPGDLPNPGSEYRSPAFRADSLPSAPPGKPNGLFGKCKNCHTQIPIEQKSFKCCCLMIKIYIRRVILVTLFSFLYLFTKTRGEKKKKPSSPHFAFLLLPKKEQCDFWPKMLGCCGP